MPYFNFRPIFKIMTTLKKLAIAAILAALFLLSGYILGRRTCRSNSPEIGVITKTDIFCKKVIF